MNPLKRFTLSIRAFAEDARAAVTVELVLVVPMLIWAFFATMIFNDAYRARTQAQAAALHVADAISRNTAIVTTEYLEGMNDVYDFLIADGETSRLRITSVVWDRDADQPLVLWSYGTRGMNALPDNTFQLMSSGDMGTLRELMDGEDGENMIAGFTQMPNTDLHNRIPPVMPGEALILVESFTMWETPLPQVFLGFDILNDTRLSPIAVVRPRFSPFINFEGAMDAAAPDASEFDGTPADPESDPDDPDTPDDDPTDSPLDTVLLDDDFSDVVAGDWSKPDVTTSNDGTIGGFLGPFGRETFSDPLTFKVDLDREMIAARIEFDLYVLDTWDGFDPTLAPEGGEQLWIGVEGTSIAAESFQMSPAGIMRANRRTTASRKEGFFTTRMELVNDNANIGGSAWADQIWRVRIDITDPEKIFDLDFRMLSDEPKDNESFGIDNLRISATAGDQAQTHFVPRGSDREGIDPYSGFQNYDDCPDPRHAGRTHNVSQSALAASNSVLRHRVEAGGRQDLSRCDDFDRDNDGYVNANPTLVFNWDNEGQSGNGNRLRIRTDDGNRGFNCDSVLAVRDPGGQWFYSGWTVWEDGRNDDWNALLDMRNAQSGTYHVFAGNWYRETCETDIVFERY